MNPKCPSNRLRLTRDDRQQHARRTFWLTPALLPVAHRGRIDAELGAELILRHPQAGSNRSHVDAAKNLRSTSACQISIIRQWRIYVIGVQTAILSSWRSLVLSRARSKRFRGLANEGEACLAPTVAAM